MDETDLALCRLLMRNSRTSYSELGKGLGLSPQVVHRRVQSLIEADILRGTYATLSFKARSAMWVVVHGWSRAASMDEVADRFESIPQTSVFQVASGNYVYVHGQVKDSKELAEYASKVKAAAEIGEPQIGIMPMPLAAESTLTNMDLRIIQALAKDARMSSTKVAEQLGTTVKTVNRRLDRMIEEDLIMMSIRWQPDTLGDTISHIHLELRDDVPWEKVAFLLIKEFAQGVVRSYTFSNMPNHVIITYWSKNVRDMQRACHELESKGIFAKVVPNIIRSVYYFEKHNEIPLNEMMRHGKNR